MAEIIIGTAFLSLFSFHDNVHECWVSVKIATFSLQYKELMVSTGLYKFLDIHGIFPLVGKDYSDLLSPVVT